MDNGDTIAFTCVAYGTPLPYITWSRNDSSLSNYSYVTVFEEFMSHNGVTVVKSTLEICGASLEDSGEYSCSADSGISSESFSFVLQVVIEGEVILVTFRMSRRIQ